LLAFSIKKDQQMISTRIFLATASLVIATTGIARADVFGRLRIKVTDAATEKPIASAKIILTDSAGVNAPITLTTDATGVATSPPLQNRTWTVVTSADAFQKDTQSVSVVADVISDVEILLEPAKEKTIKITAERDRIRTGDAASSVLSSDTINKFPLTGSNRQALNKTVRANPGFVDDSVNQSHPRGEHAATSIYINGFLLPGAFQGRAGQFLSPEAIQTIDVITGGFAPEYGSETAAALNLTLKSGTIAPLRLFTLSGGGFGTGEAALTLGGQSGDTHKLGYLINYNGRSTENAIEAPQPNRQNAHNRQTNQTFFANFDYGLTPTDQLTLTVNTAPASTQIANRTGLGASYASVGQGFGYAGRRNADGTIPGDSEADTIVLGSQQDLGQRITQDDNNTFGTLQLRRQINPSTSAILSFGSSESKQNLNNTTSGNSPDFSVSALPIDSSIEFHPTVRRTYKQNQLQANITQLRGSHSYKFGGLYSDQSGNESYRFVPASQTALLELAQIDKNLVPDGSVRTNSDGDVTGVDPAFTGTAKTVRVKRSGYYAAAYAQDTYKFSPKLTINYGLRFDAYKAEQDLGQPDVKQSDLSPRVNIAYTILPRTVARASYNRLFSQPPLAQGALIGNSAVPQKVTMIESSIERQFPNNQTVKIAGYKKWNSNQLDTAILIPGTQTSVFVTSNIGRSYTNGLEFTYDRAPKNNIGLGGYLTWANAINKIIGTEEPYSDHDQLNTLTLGTSYTLPSGIGVSATGYYGSGAFSSAIRDDKRNSRTEVNLKIASGPTLFKNGLSADFLIENLFDSRNVINFNSPFTGTRFQQGRRVMLSFTNKF
jgi:hypothetical protein